MNSNELTFQKEQVQISYTQYRPWVLNDDERELLLAHLHGHVYSNQILIAIEISQNESNNNLETHERC